MYYLYIAESIEFHRWYVGMSDDPLRRIGEHNKGKTHSTKPYRPYKLIYTEEYQTRDEARAREVQVKRSGLVRKELRTIIEASSSSPV